MKAEGWALVVLVVLVTVLYLYNLQDTKRDLHTLHCSTMYIGERVPLVFKCVEEVTSLLAAYSIPHFFSLPLHKLELEPLLEANLFRTPPDAHLQMWIGDAVEARWHLKMLPHSVHKYVCQLNGFDPETRLADCEDAMPVREVVDAVLPARRIMFDAGASGFPTSVGWFKINYPVEFDRIFVWEMLPEVFNMIDASQASADYNVTLAEATRWLDSITFFNARIHTTPDQSEGDMVNTLLTHVRPEDFCVVKIDIEGAEWDLIPHLIETGAVELIDELFVEIHFHHHMLAQNSWTPENFPHSITETAELMAKLRTLPNLIFHYWP